MCGGLDRRTAGALPPSPAAVAGVGAVLIVGPRYSKHVQQELPAKASQTIRRRASEFGGVVREEDVTLLLSRPFSRVTRCPLRRR